MRSSLDLRSLKAGCKLHSTIEAFNLSTNRLQQILIKFDIDLLQMLEVTAQIQNLIELIQW